MPIELLKMKIMLLFFIFWNIQSGKAIYGGKEVIPNQYPWVLILRFYHPHAVPSVYAEMNCTLLKNHNKPYKNAKTI